MLETDLHPLGAYTGGKSSPGAWQTIINQIPPCSLYAELFIGHGAVVRRLRPAPASLGVDADAAVIAAWEGHQIPGLRVIHGDGLTVLRSYPWQPADFIYLDPPYPEEVRLTRRDLYAHEFRHPEQHRALLKAARSVPCRVMVSSYYSELYATELAGWRTLTYTAVDRGGNVREEWLWSNYPEPLELHDGRYIGDGWRERDRIGRKAKRWLRMLQEMPLADRTAVLSAIDELRASAALVRSGEGHRGRTRHE
ncbi:MAG: DNA adenine methylase [Actinomycetota bacterium]